MLQHKKIVVVYKTGEKVSSLGFQISYISVVSILINFENFLRYWRNLSRKNPLEQQV